MAPARSAVGRGCTAPSGSYVSQRYSTIAALTGARIGGIPRKGTHIKAHAPPLSASVRSPSVITGLLPRGCTLTSSGGASPFTCRGRRRWQLASNLRPHRHIQRKILITRTLTANLRPRRRIQRKTLITPHPFVVLDVVRKPQLFEEPEQLTAPGRLQVVHNNCGRRSHSRGHIAEIVKKFATGMTSLAGDRLWVVNLN